MWCGKGCPIGLIIKPIYLAAGRAYVFSRQKEVEFFTNSTVATFVSILVTAAYGDDVVVFGWICNGVFPDPPYIGGCSNEYLEKYPGGFVQLWHICMDVVGKCKRIYYNIGSCASFKKSSAQRCKIGLHNDIRCNEQGQLQCISKGIKKPLFVFLHELFFLGHEFA